MMLLFSCSVVSNSLHHKDGSMPGFPVLHYFLEFTQTHVHWIGDAIQPSYLLSALCFLPSIFPSIRVFSNEYFAWGGQSIGASALESVLPLNIHHWFPLGLTGLISLLSKRFSRVQHHSSKASILWYLAFFIVKF